MLILFRSLFLPFACSSSVNITPDGLAAIMKLAAGDMRKSLNVLQACHLAYKQRIDEDAVYASTGNPTPADMQKMINLLHNEPLKQAFDSTNTST